MDFHARRFDRAARSYGALSGIQESMADRLLALLPAGSALPSAGAGILEMGCGTGHLTRRLGARFPSSPLLATDAAPRMLEEAAKGLTGRTGFATAILDARGPAGGVPAGVRAAAPFSLAASGALVQWFPALEAHFSLVAGLLAPGGLYLVSGFLKDNFPELNALLAEEPFGHRDFPGHGASEVEAAARKAGFVPAALKTAGETAEYPGARAFLEHIKGLGSARRPDGERPLTRGSLDLLLARYQERYGITGNTGGGRAGGDGPVRATWRTWYALLRKT